MLEALAMAAPFVLAGERSLFHFPNPKEVRVQKIVRAGNERDWPFSIESGNLACIWSAGRKQVFFVEMRPEDINAGKEFMPRYVIVSANPFDLTFGNMADRTLFAPMTDVAELVRRAAPYAALGERLCDLPPGTIVRPGEL